MNSSLLYKFYISFNQNDSRWLQSIDKLNHKITRSLVAEWGAQLDQKWVLSVGPSEEIPL